MGLRTTAIGCKFDKNDVFWPKRGKKGVNLNVFSVFSEKCQKGVFLTFFRGFSINFEIRRGKDMGILCDF